MPPEKCTYSPRDTVVFILYSSSLRMTYRVPCLLSYHHEIILYSALNRLRFCLIKPVPMKEAHINYQNYSNISKNIHFRICPFGVVLLKFQNFPPTLHYFCTCLANLGLSFLLKQSYNF